VIQRSCILGAVLVVAGVGCDTRSTEPTTPAAPSAESASGASSAQAALDSLDERSPVPLLPMMANHQKANMRDHLVAVQEIIAALGSKDFAAIEKSAGRIGYSEQMGQMCTHMGAGAPGFRDRALDFHRTANKIGDAAKQRDEDAVIQALSETLATCTGCHAAYKQQVVDEPTWTAATSMAAPLAPMPR
jgi:hypothetical protein